MKYKLLDTGKGVLLKRNTEVVMNNVRLLFDNSPAGASAFFTCGGDDNKL